MLVERLGRVRAALPGTEAIFVEGGSTDRSGAVVDELAATYPWIRALHDDAVGNLAHAWRMGVAHATGTHVALMDADLCHDPEFLPTLRRELDAGADLAIASRVEGLRVRMPHKALYRRGATLLSGVSFRMATGYRGRDPAHGFRMFRRASYEAVIGTMQSAGNAWAIELVWRFMRRGLVVVETPVPYGRRIHGRDQLSAPREARRYAALLWRIVAERLAAWIRIGGGHAI